MAVLNTNLYLKDVQDYKHLIIPKDAPLPISHSIFVDAPEKTLTLELLRDEGEPLKIEFQNIVSSRIYYVTFAIEADYKMKVTLQNEMKEETQELTIQL